MSQVELTPYSRECASLWREVFGIRSGHYKAAATAASKLKQGRGSLGCFAEWFVAFFVVARLAVALARLKAKCGSSSASVVHSGAGTAESALWSESMNNFQQ